MTIAEMNRQLREIGLAWEKWNPYKHLYVILIEETDKKPKITFMLFQYLEFIILNLWKSLFLKNLW